MSIIKNNTDRKIRICPHKTTDNKPYRKTHSYCNLKNSSLIGCPANEYGLFGCTWFKPINF
jgi:hypothetical protein